MTYCVCIENREAAGLQPVCDISDDEWFALGWEKTGYWSCGWGWVSHITDWCAPILDHMPHPQPLGCDANGVWSDAIWQQQRAAQSADAGRVLACKFASNDSWLFTPHECHILAYHLVASPDERLRELGRFFGWAGRFGGCTAG